MALATATLLCVLGCAPREQEERWRRLEERVSALERAASPAAGPETTTIGDDLRSLERRLAALEQRRTTPGAGAGPTEAPATPADAAEARLAQRRERRALLRDLTDEYRARLAQIRQEQTDPAARQQAVREALAWYREQRRAILAGDEPAAP
jgi:hypothetical protein